MSDENEPPELFTLPVTQKEAWTYAWKVAGIAAYFWLYNHFVSIEKHDKDMEHIDNRYAMLDAKLAEIDKHVAQVSQQLIDEEKGAHH